MPRTSLEALPPEVHAIIQRYLPTADVLSTRLASSTCSYAFRLRFNRVYLSTSSFDISVLRAIADHPSYRHGIEELVWDDARLVTKPRGTGTWPDRGHYDDEDDYRFYDKPGHYAVYDKPGHCPDWFRKACERSVEELKFSPCGDGPLPHHLRKRARLHAAWDLDKCWEYYEKLLNDQDEVLQSDAAAEAFRYALQRFPSLRTLIITPTAHGKLFMPLYRSPKIRSFPDELIYPIPHPWPYCDPGTWMPEIEAWNSNDPVWRGYSRILETLAACENNIIELIVDTRGAHTGINCYAVCDDCPEQSNLAKMCAKEGFRRLDLGLFVNGLEHDGFQPLRSGAFYSALSAATGMEHFHFSTTLEMDESGEAAQLQYIYEDLDTHTVPLISVFPVDRWSNLRFFGLTKFLVLGSDLVDLLSALPVSVRRVELNFLMFLKRGTYGGLLEQMRQQLDWPGRLSESRPRVTMSVPRDGNDRETLVVTVGDDQIDAFLYQNGPNPFFRSEMNALTNYAEWGSGAVEWDVLEPERRRPYEDDTTQYEKGYYGYIDWDDHGSS